MDLVGWVEEAESLLRSDGLCPERDEERAGGVLEDAALEGPESLARAMHVLRRELPSGAPRRSGWAGHRPVGEVPTK